MKTLKPVGARNRKLNASTDKESSELRKRGTDECPLPAGNELLTLADRCGRPMPSFNEETSGPYVILVRHDANKHRVGRQRVTECSKDYVSPEHINFVVAYSGRW